MTSAAVASRIVALPCEACGESVITAYRPGGKVVLDAERVIGGIFTLDSAGRAQRRALVEVYRDSKRKRPAKTYRLHECAGPRQWYERD